MSQYKRGADFERRVALYYESLAFDVIRSAGSHGPSDVTAFLHGIIVFNSLRLNNYWSPAEREAFEALVKRHPTAIGKYVWREKGTNKILFKDALE